MWHIVNSVTGQDNLLDNPAWYALNGPQAGFAERKGQARRFQPDFCPFYGMPLEPTEEDWADVADLAGPGGLVTLAATWTPFPEGWELGWGGEGVQLVGGDEVGRDVPADREVIRLGPDDVPEVLDLVERTRPGPFRPRTIELGTYLGVRREGALVALAGERLRLDGYTEVSAVCTDEAWRGHGFASRLTLAVAAGIRERGEIPFLHAVATNLNAIRLYEQLGFEFRQAAMFKTARVPE
ncbi:MAG: acetyltransferase [Actinomycetia bacterium]|nr:acetyltransferase [Actinomycetes bacterium]